MSEEYKNIIIKTLETKLIIAKDNQQNEMYITVDVLQDILTLLKQNDTYIQALSSIINDQEKREDKLVNIIKELSKKGGGAKWLRKFKIKI